MEYESVPGMGKGGAFNATRFDAPWGALLKGMTALSVSVLVVAAIIGLSTGPRALWWWWLIMVGMPVLILVTGMLFMIRGYELMPDGLYIIRPYWRTRIPLSDLLFVKTDRYAMKGSLRTFGNGGMFCFAGRFWNRKLGSFRAFVTDRKRSVILRFVNGQTIVVSPHDPDAFAAMVRTMTGVPE